MGVCVTLFLEQAFALIWREAVVLLLSLFAVQGAVQWYGTLAVAVAERQHLVAEYVLAAGVVMHAAETFEMMPGLFQCGVIHDVEVWHIPRLATASLHYAQELFRHSQQQAAPVIGGIGEETVEAVLSHTLVKQTVPFRLVETEHANLKDAYEQQVEQQHGTWNALLLGYTSHLHEVTQSELVPNRLYKYFDACPYYMIGFAENRDGKVCAVLVQPFIADARLATKEENHDEFLRLGFHSEDDGECYSNGQHDIFDAVDGNVLIDDEGNMFFIDTIIYASDTGGVDKYNSLSPRAKSSKKEQ